MVLEYVEGGSLFAGTRIAPACQVSELTARKYFRDVVKVLNPFYFWLPSFWLDHIQGACPKLEMLGFWA